MAEPVVTFDNVSKKFNRAQRFTSIRDLVPALVSSLFSRQDDELHGQEFWALKDVSFEVRPGQALGIIGPNGAGKSTVLKVLARILRPDHGTSLVKGRVGSLVEIAAGFHQDLTGRENVFMQGSIMGMRRAEIARKFDEIVEFAGVSEFIDTPVKRYSSGMNARLGFAVAAHLDPDVLLIDEVLSVGDLNFQEKCYARMQQFVRSGIAVVFVSHNLSAVSYLCDRVLVLKRGRIETLAPTHEAITAYANLVQEARIDEVGSDEVFLRLQDASGSTITEISAGETFTVRVVAVASSDGRQFCGELQIRHLESGTLIYRGQSWAAGAEPLELEAGTSMELVWSVQANLGRAHYAISCAILNERRQWVAVSAATLLSVNERTSELAMVYVAPRCTARPLDVAPSPMAVLTPRS